MNTNYQLKLDVILEDIVNSEKYQLHYIVASTM